MSTLRYCANYSIPGWYFAGLNSSLAYIIRLRFLPLYRIRIRLYFIYIFLIIFIIFVTVTCYLLVTVLLLAVLLQY